jgi:uncharacterized membrane protein YhaH (DUF805 family)
MGFGGAIATGFRKYVDFTGRARRPEYWFWMLFYWLLLIGLSILDAVVFGASGGGVFGLLGILALALPTIAVATRRLHDTDRSGWWQLFGLVPLVGGITLLVFMCLRGTDGPNRFGPDDVDVAAEFD